MDKLDERHREMRKHLFPSRRLWFDRFLTWKPIWFGTDEWMRHTLVVGVPYVISIVIAFKWCDCDDEIDHIMACDFPGCPAKASFKVGDDPAFCMTHDADYYRRWLAGEYDDE